METPCRAPGTIGHGVPAMTAAELPAEKRPMGSLEAGVLGILWTNGEAMTPGEVHAELGDGLAYTTVMTILTRLLAKGLVSRSRSGRAFAYLPTVTEAEHAAQKMRKTLAAVSDPKYQTPGSVGRNSMSFRAYCADPEPAAFGQERCNTPGLHRGYCTLRTCGASTAIKNSDCDTPAIEALPPLRQFMLGLPGSAWDGGYE